MVKFPEAEARKFRNIFICRKCKNKRKSPNMKIIQGKVRCRTCGSTSFKAVRKK
jgi:formylmethanofuran dehydrogenase subunit E